jgi:3-deoxy-manno-octulosonate cytidylyltransferase (CMP-KDO synthetase)
MMKVVCIIPVRMKSKRLSGKPLMIIAGRTMVEHVYLRCKKAGRFDGVYIAYCDTAVRESLPSSTWMTGTPSDCRNGTERCYHAAKNIGLKDEDYVVNVQGDEPMIDPKMLRAFTVWLWKERPEFATIGIDAGLSSRSTVKVYPGTDDNVLDFNRSAVYKHVGVYAYTFEVLKKYMQLPINKDERSRHLEQLRFRGANTFWFTLCKLFIYPKYDGISVNTIDDLNDVRKMMGD